MTRPTIPSGFDVNPQYFALVTDGSGAVLGQVRSINPQLTMETTQAGRVGSSTKKTLKKTKSGTLSLEMWADEDLAEIAVALNRSAAPSSGDTVQLDSDAAATDIYIKRYDGESASANLIDILYCYQYTATEMSWTFDEDGEQVVSVSGTIEDLYSVRA